MVWCIRKSLKNIVIIVNWRYKMNFKKSVIGIGSAALLGLSGVANSAELVIDLFSTDQGLHLDLAADGDAVGNAVSTAGGDILGGERDLYVNQDRNDGTSTFVSGGVSGGKFNFGVNPGAFGSGVVQWDGVDSAGDTGTDASGNTSDALSYGLGSVNLSVFDFFKVVTESSDLGFEFLVGLYTSATEFTEFTLRAHEVTPGFPVTSFLQLDTFAQSIFFSGDALNGSLVPAGSCDAVGGYGTFVNPDVLNMTCGSAGVVNLMDVNAIQLIIDPDAKGVNGNGAIDLQLSSISATVPEPSLLALLGLGMLGAAATRRKAIQS